MRGLVVMACALLGIREPMEFYALSPSAQETWIDHARNLVTRAYERPAKTGSNDDARARAAMAAFIASRAAE